MKQLLIWLIGAVSVFGYGFFVGPHMETKFDTAFLFLIGVCIVAATMYASLVLYMVERDLFSYESLKRSFNGFSLSVTLCLVASVAIGIIWSPFAAIFFALGQMLFFYGELLVQSQYLKKYVQETFNDEDFEI